MQRSQVKIGESYAVTSDAAARRRSAHAGEPECVKGTVVALDAKHEVSAGRYSRLTRTVHDGIKVTFEKPVEFSYFGVSTVSRGKKGTKEIVLGDARQLVKLWSEHEADEAMSKTMRERWAREADEWSAAFKPTLDATIAAIKKHTGEKVGIYGDCSGIHFHSGSISLKYRKGTDGKRKIIGFDYGNSVNIEADLFCKLIGVKHADAEDSVEDDD